MHIHIYALCYFIHYIHVYVYTCLGFVPPPPSKLPLYFSIERVFFLLTRIRHSDLLAHSHTFVFFFFFFHFFLFSSPAMILHGSASCLNFFNNYATPFLFRFVFFSSFPRIAHVNHIWYIRGFSSSSISQIIYIYIYIYMIYMYIYINTIFFLL